MLFQISTTHPAMPGHFPDNPVVPGVVIIDHVLETVAAEMPGYQVVGIRKLRFLQPLLPGQVFSVQLADMSAGRLRFECLQGATCLAAGSLLLEMRPYSEQ